jgi:hypothetical protein
MVNLGQKGWKQFHLFYFQIKLVQYKKAEMSHTSRLFRLILLRFIAQL